MCSRTELHALLAHRHARPDAGGALHGATDNGLCWSRRRALEAEYDVIMVDARGHGLSDKPEGDYGRANRAMTSPLITALGLDRPHLVGH